MLDLKKTAHFALKSMYHMGGSTYNTILSGGHSLRNVLESFIKNGHNERDN